MRTIKFKGTCITPEREGETVYGSLLALPDEKVRILEPCSGVYLISALLTPIPSASSLASPIRTARRFMKATCCGQTNILIAASEIKSATTTMPWYIIARKELALAL